MAVGRGLACIFRIAGNMLATVLLFFSSIYLSLHVYADVADRGLLKKFIGLWSGKKEFWLV
ncbi:MAG: hypothetical protein A2252_06310 [Elusimicrobia bacterium RIFOXYA2_FULL_39_19]|nr:MAG: hypothetical protein A2252_06310 [Elusimicrobia bacterium RIFOXYA2_FULL_39_19]